MLFLNNDCSMFYWVQKACQKQLAFRGTCYCDHNISVTPKCLIFSKACNDNHSCCCCCFFLGGGGGGGGFSILARNCPLTIVFIPLFVSIFFPIFKYQLLQLKPAPQTPAIPMLPFNLCPFRSSLRPPLHELRFIFVSLQVPWERCIDNFLQKYDSSLFYREKSNSAASNWIGLFSGVENNRERRDLAPDILHEIIVKQRPDRITGYNRW